MPPRDLCDAATSPAFFAGRWDRPAFPDTLVGLVV